MKRSITIFSIVLFLLLSINTVTTFAQARRFTQGIYNATDANLLIGNPINARITSTNDRALILIIDSNQIIQALVRLGAQIPQQVLPPLSSDSSIVIFGNGTVELS